MSKLGGDTAFRQLHDKKAKSEQTFCLDSKLVWVVGATSSSREVTFCPEDSGNVLVSLRTIICNPLYQHINHALGMTREKAEGTTGF
jgi:hypothetical protein